MGCMLLGAGCGCRNVTLEKQCDAMLDAQYGSAAADMIRKSQLMEHPLRLVVNGEWDKQVDGEILALLQSRMLKHANNYFISCVVTKADRLLCLHQQHAIRPNHFWYSIFWPLAAPLQLPLLCYVLTCMGTVPSVTSVLQ